MFSLKAKKDELLEHEKGEAATIIQCMVRKHQAQIHVKARARRFWQRVFDPKFKLYFWYNKFSGQSQWTVPKYMTLYNDHDHQVGTKIEKVVRGFLGRMKVRRLVHSRYTRFYDSNLNRFYWMENSTKKTTWKVSEWMVKQQVPLPPEDEMLYKSGEWQAVYRLRRSREG
jgi:hypothetical protein